MPSIVSVLCFAMSLATGTAFGSMGIMFPLVVPLAAQLSNGDESALFQGNNKSDGAPLAHMLR